MEVNKYTLVYIDMRGAVTRADQLGIRLEGFPRGVSEVLRRARSTAHTHCCWINHGIIRDCKDSWLG